MSCHEVLFCWFDGNPDFTVPTVISSSVANVSVGLVEIYTPVPSDSSRVLRYRNVLTYLLTYLVIKVQ